MPCHHGRYGVSYIDRLVQERCNSSALAMELYLCCTDPSMCAQYFGGRFKCYKEVHLYVSFCLSNVYTIYSVCVVLMWFHWIKLVTSCLLFWFCYFLSPLCLLPKQCAIFVTSRVISLLEYLLHISAFSKVAFYIFRDLRIKSIYGFFCIVFFYS